MLAVDPRHPPPRMLSVEEPTEFLRRVFAACFIDMDPTAAEAATRRYFDPFYVHEADGRTLTREEFIQVLRSQKRRLSAPPRISYKSMVATSPRSGMVHVTSVHTSFLQLKDGANLAQSVLCLVEIDVTRGKIMSCDELTRMEPASGRPPAASSEQPLQGSAMEALRAKALPPAEVVSSCEPAGRDSFTMNEIEELRAQVFADDVPIPAGMASWSRHAVTAYFESPPLPEAPLAEAPPAETPPAETPPAEAPLAEVASTPALAPTPTPDGQLAPAARADDPSASACAIAPSRGVTGPAGAQKISFDQPDIPASCRPLATIGAAARWNWFSIMLTTYYMAEAQPARRGPAAREGVRPSRHQMHRRRSPGHANGSARHVAVR